jgi:hypothetical protein
MVEARRPERRIEQIRLPQRHIAEIGAFDAISSLRHRRLRDIDRYEVRCRAIGSKGDGLGADPAARFKNEAATGIAYV